MFAAILFIFYLQTKSVKASLLALFYPVVSIIYVFAVALYFGMVLNVMTVMSVSFLIVIGSAYGLHFYNGVLRFGKDVRKKMFRPIFYSMSTTAAGFLSFLFVNIQAFREMGLLVSAGLGLNFLLLFTSGYELMARVGSKTTKKTILLKVSSKRVGIGVLISVVILVVVSPLLLRNIVVGMDQVAYFNEKSEISQAMGILRDHFSYREPVYIVLKKGSSFTLRDGEVLREIVVKLSNIDGISSVQFPTSYPLPALLLARRFQPVVSYFVADNQTIRLVANLTSVGYTKSLQLKEQIQNVLKDYANYSFTLASAAFVVEEINAQIVRNQLQTFLVSLLFIFVMILIAFRNVPLSLIIVLPVMLTGLVNFIFMSVMKIRLEIASSIVASILIGLVVDYSIHLAHDLRVARDVDASIKNVGMPILTNAMGLIAGFLVLSFSELALFRNLSWLLCLGIGFGCAFTLFSEPLILERILASRVQNDLIEKDSRKASKAAAK